MTPARMEAAIEKAFAMLRAKEPRVITHLSKRCEVERTLKNLAETAAKGGAVTAVLEALNRAETERRALVAQSQDGCGSNLGAQVSDTL